MFHSENRLTGCLAACWNNYSKYKLSDLGIRVLLYHSSDHSSYLSPTDYDIFTVDDFNNIQNKVFKSIFIFNKNNDIDFTTT